MPIILHENIENGKIGVWKVTESMEGLLQQAQLSPDDTKRYSEISAPHRQKEWLATRALLNGLFSVPKEICYHQDGRPFIRNSEFNLSISHSNGYVSVFLLSDSFPGIDIELVSRQVGKVAGRFLSQEELAACNDENGVSNFKMLLHWCAKEAIFKILPLSNIEFATELHVFIEERLGSEGSFRGSFEYKTGCIPISLSYRILDDILIVWGALKISKFDFCIPPGFTTVNK